MKYALLFFCLPLVMRAQMTDTLAPVTVQATMVSTTKNIAPRQVVILSRQDIEALPAQTVNELLEYALGIDIRQRGPMDVQADVQLRGGTFEQTLIMVDGIRMNDPQTGHHNMDLTLTPDQIEQIVVVLGGGSRVYGQGAFAGSINILTRKNGASGTRLWANGGSFGSYQVGAREQIKGKNHYTTVGMQRTASDGYRPNTDFFHNQASLNSSIQAGKYAIQLTSGFAWKGFGAQDFYSSSFPTQYEATSTLLAGLTVTSGSQLQIERTLYYRRHSDRFELFRETGGPYQYVNGQFVTADSVFAPAWYTGHNYHLSEAYGGSLKGTYKLGNTSTTLRFDYRGEEIMSNVLGEPLQAPVQVGSTRGQYSRGARRDNFSLHLEESVYWNGWFISGGALLNYNTAFGWDLLPGADVSYTRGNHTLYGSINRSFRFPTYTDLYYRLGGAVGSLDLTPEYSTNLELGYRWKKNALEAGVALYQRKGTNLIDWVLVPGDSVVRARNITEVTMRGAEASVRYTQPKRAFFQGAELTAAYQQTAEDDFAFESLYVLDYLTLKVGASAQFSLWKALSLNIQGNLQDRNGQFNNAETSQLEDYPTVFLLDAKLRYTFPKAELFVEANNLLNQVYYDRGNIPMPGTWVRGGVSLIF